MKILLTGGLGFIGKNFLLHRPKDWQVFTLDLIEDEKFQKNCQNCRFWQVDLTDEPEVKRLAKKMPRFDACLHLAANGDPALSVPDPTGDLKSTTLTLINTCQNFKIKKLIYLSSGAVYEGRRGLVGPKTPIEPILPYAISHYAAEQYTRFFQKSGKIKEYLILRFFGAYGPYEPPRKIYTKLVKDFVIENKKEFLIRGNGLNLIDAMFVEDAIAGFVKAIKSKKSNLTVDFCQGDHPTINELVKTAAEIFKIKVRIKHQGVVPEYNQFYASTAEFQRLFDFRAKISLKEGISKLYKFIKSEIRNPKSETNHKL